METYNDQFWRDVELVKEKLRIHMMENNANPPERLLLQPYQLPQLDLRRIGNDPKYRVHMFLHMGRMEDETAWKTAREIAFEVFIPHRHDAGQQERVVAYLNELLAEGVVIRRDDRWRVVHPLDG